MEEGGAIGEPRHGGEGPRPSGGMGVPGVGVRVSESVDFREMV